MSSNPIDPTEAHVLVVEDNVPNFVLIARMLAFMGVQRLRVEDIWMASSTICGDVTTNRPHTDGYSFAI